MIPTKVLINELPTDESLGTQMANRILYQAGFKNQEAIPEYTWKAVKLAYELGYQRCANLHFI
jgi:hypothetical protein